MKPHHGTHSHFEEQLLLILIKLNETLEKQNQAIQRNTHAIEEGIWKIAEEINLAGSWQ